MVFVGELCLLKSADGFGVEHATVSMVRGNEIKVQYADGTTQIFAAGTFEAAQHTGEFFGAAQMEVAGDYGALAMGESNGASSTTGLEMAPVVFAHSPEGEVEEPPSMAEIMEKAKARAFRGGIAGAGAMAIQVCTLMWMRTAMNYQYRHGGTFTNALKTLYGQGGIRRFYRGIGPGLLQGPLSRFGDTAANAGVLAILDSRADTKDLPSAVKTVAASAAAASWRVFLMPIDTVKTTLQVEGKPGIQLLRAKAAKGGPAVFYHGAMGAMSATFVGHYPWFATYNALDAYFPKYDGEGEKLKQLGSNAAKGFSASVVSDCISNSLRVLKTYRQTSEVNVGYMEAAQTIIKKEGMIGLFGRGLKTRILANGTQGIMFSVMWKHFQSMMN